MKIIQSCSMYPICWQTPRQMANLSLQAWSIVVQQAPAVGEVRNGCKVVQHVGCDVCQAQQVGQVTPNGGRVVRRLHQCFPAVEALQLCQCSYNALNLAAAGPGIFQAHAVYLHSTYSPTLFDLQSRQASLHIASLMNASVETNSPHRCHLCQLISAKLCSSLEGSIMHKAPKQMACPL